MAAVIDHIVSKVQEKLLFVLSSDLSHFHNQDMAQKLDAQAARLIETGQFNGLGPGLACGHLAIAGFLALTAGQGTRVLRLAMADSFAVTQDAKRVVGYGVWAFFFDRLRGSVARTPRNAFASGPSRNRHVFKRRPTTTYYAQ